MSNSVPIPIFYEGGLTLNETLYRYESSRGTLKLSGYRVTSKNSLAGTIIIDVCKNGVVMYQIPMTSTDTGTVALPGIFFDTGDVWTLVLSATHAHSNELSFVFTAEVAEAILESDLPFQIQTPLIARMAGSLSTGTTLLKHTFTCNAWVSGFSAFLRVAGNGTTTMGLYRDGSLVDSSISFGSGDLTLNDSLALYFTAGETLEVKVTAIPGTPPVSLSILLDWKNLDQTQFQKIQAPFLLEFEKLSTGSGTILWYNATRTSTLLLVQAALKSGTASVAHSINLKVNGTTKTTTTIAAGDSHSQIVQSAIREVPIAAGDLIELELSTPASPDTDLWICLDYYIPQADSTSEFVYYSDPDSDIILKARQVGIGQNKVSALPLAGLERYKMEVQGILNARLSALYHTPLRKVRNGTAPWPEPIQTIAQRLVLARLLQDIYSEVEPNASNNPETQRRLAEQDLDSLLSRQYILRGQSLRSRNYGSNPYTEPLASPSSTQEPHA